MVLSDFLSRQINDMIVILMKLCLFLLTCIKYYTKIIISMENYLGQTRSQAKYSGIKLLEVHGMERYLDPNIKPEKQHGNPIKDSVVKPHIGQGRAGLKRKGSDPISQTINPPSELSQKIPGETKIETGKTNQIYSRDPTHSINNVGEGMTHTRPLIPHVPFHLGPTYRPPPKPIRSNMPRSQESLQSSTSTENINPDINLDFKQNSPFQEGIISEAYQILDKSFFKEPKILNNLVNTGNLIQKFFLYRFLILLYYYDTYQKFFLKEEDIDKILNVIQR